MKSLSASFLCVLRASVALWFKRRRPSWSSWSSCLCVSVVAAAALTACSTANLSSTQPAITDIKPENKLPSSIQSDPTQWRGVWLMTNFNEDKQLAANLELAQRAAKAGYTHMVVSDVKFMKWDFMSPRYADNVKKFMDTCHSLNLKVWACCAPMGYANSLLMRDPNLAEGLPVEGEFIVDQALYLKPYDPDLKLQNGDFAQVTENAPASWTSSNFNKSIFIDKEVTWNAKPTLRIDSAAAPATRPSGEAAAAGETTYAPGVSQSITVKPFHYYHLHAMIKTEGLALKRGTQIEVRADQPGNPEDRTILNYQTPVLLPTTDWQPFDMTFNSLEFSNVKLTLPGRQSRGGGGAGIQGSGTIHWADLTIEPGQFVNVIRRPGAPVSISTSLKRKLHIDYVEGKDITSIVDPFLGRSPGAGSFTIWHTPPVVSILPGGRLHEGDIVSVGYYVPAIVHSDQVMCCMSEPKTLELVKWEIQHIHQNMNPDGYFTGHDELRSQGYDKSCTDTHKSMHEILADNLRAITHIITTEAPGKDICTWSDLFDPFHNAKNDGKRYYLVKGISPWYGAWTGLDKDVIIMNWHGPFDGNQHAALKFFSDLGNRQILSGYYDKPIEPFRQRLDDASHYPGVIGSMYTTWTSNFTLMEPFAQLMKDWKSQANFPPRTLPSLQGRLDNREAPRRSPDMQ
jgi:hypothetical protein